MGALLDLIRVLWSPGAVFDRVRARPRVLVPMAGIVVLAVVVGFLALPYVKAGIAAALAQQQQRPQGGPSVDSLATIQVAASAVFIPIFLLLSAGIMWVTVSLLGEEAKYKLLLAVATYAATLYVAQLLAGFAVLSMRGIAAVTSPEDLQPAFGLDLLFPNVTGYLGAVLKGINVFSIWGVIVQGIGISRTHRVSSGVGFTAAGVAFAVLVLLVSLFALLQPAGGAGG